MSDLVDAGYDVTKVGSLRQSYPTDREAVPVLVRWLPLVHDYNLRETMFRALAVPSAKKEALETVVDQLRDLRLDQSYGRTREMVVRGMAKS